MRTGRGALTSRRWSRAGLSTWTVEIRQRTKSCGMTLLAGEVWLLSGQSNMELPVGLDRRQHAWRWRAAHDPKIRFLLRWSGTTPRQAPNPDVTGNLGQVHAQLDVQRLLGRGLLFRGEAARGARPRHADRPDPQHVLGLGGRAVGAARGAEGRPQLSPRSSRSLMTRRPKRIVAKKDAVSITQFTADSLAKYNAALDADCSAAIDAADAGQKGIAGRNPGFDDSGWVTRIHLPRPVRPAIIRPIKWARFGSGAAVDIPARPRGPGPLVGRCRRWTRTCMSTSMARKSPTSEIKSAWLLRYPHSRRG